MDSAIQELDRHGYEVLRKIKEGGMGLIYLVLHRRLDEIRVAKFMKPEFAADPAHRDRFLREARIASRVRHPNIASMFDFVASENGVTFIVMEFIDGVTLLDLIRSGERPSSPMCIEIAIQGIEALGWIHHHGIVHRDISPDNVMLTRNPENWPLVKLIDLGIAKDPKGTAPITIGGGFTGKYTWAAPERLLAPSSPVQPVSDLYSFGFVFYYLLTGELPFLEEMGQLSSDPLPFAQTDPDGRIPPALRKVVMDSLRKDPSQRIATASEFNERLLQLQDRAAVHPAELDGLLKRAPSTDKPIETTPQKLENLLAEAREFVESSQFDEALRVYELAHRVVPWDNAIREQMAQVRSRLAIVEQLSKIPDPLSSTTAAVDAHQRLDEVRSAYDKTVLVLSPDPGLESRIADLDHRIEIGQELAHLEKRFRSHVTRGEFKQARSCLDDRTVWTGQKRRLATLVQEVDQAEYERSIGAARQALARGELGAASDAVAHALRLRPGDPDARAVEKGIRRAQHAIEAAKESRKKLDELAVEITEFLEFVAGLDTTETLAQAELEQRQTDAKGVAERLRELAGEESATSEAERRLEELEAARDRLKTVLRNRERERIAADLERAEALQVKGRHRKALRLLRRAESESRDREHLADLLARTRSVVRASRRVLRDRSRRRILVLTAAVALVALTWGVWKFVEFITRPDPRIEPVMALSEETMTEIRTKLERVNELLTELNEEDVLIAEDSRLGAMLTGEEKLAALRGLVEQANAGKAPSQAAAEGKILWGNLVLALRHFPDDPTAIRIRMEFEELLRNLERLTQTDILTSPGDRPAAQ